MRSDGSMRADPSRPPLRGRTVVTTREQRGDLDSALAQLGADVVHVPLIATVAPADGGAQLADALDRLDEFDWVIVTSAAGAARVAAALVDIDIRIAVVGSRTADEVRAGAGRDPDVTPHRQTALDLVASMPEPSATGSRVLLAQADRADPAHAAAFADRGYEVTTVTAYRTVLRRPTAAERAAALAADALTLASGSAATAWHDAIGTDTPAVVAAIGPSTAAVAADEGIKVTNIAADHSVKGLVAEVLRSLRTAP
jgi:uroporphyrinogen-III synthase